MTPHGFWAMRARARIAVLITVATAAAVVVPVAAGEKVGGGADESPAQAQPIAQNTVVAGAFQGSEDYYDYYSFHAQAGQTLTFTLKDTTSPCSGTNDPYQDGCPVYGWLADASNQQLGGPDSAAGGNTSAGKNGAYSQQTSWAWKFSQTGTYYIGLTDDQGPAIPAGTPSYTIEFTVTSSPFTLRVSRSGGGSGTVTSSPGGISCPSTCSNKFASGTSVGLAAHPASGSVFAGWSGGGCSGTGTCQVKMDADKTVAARFVHKPDAKIKLHSDSSWIGAGVYNTTGVGQTRAVKATRRQSETFDIAVQNRGTTPATFKLKGLGGAPGFRVTYLAGRTGSTEISTAVEAGTYALSDVPARGTRYIRLRVTVRSSAATGTSLRRTITATSRGTSAAKDVVKAVVGVIRG